MHVCVIAFEETLNGAVMATMWLFMSQFKVLHFICIYLNPITLFYPKKFYPRMVSTASCVFSASSMKRGRTNT